jgi:hypothetical protein
MTKFYVRTPQGRRIIAFDRKDAERLAARIEGATILTIPVPR